MNFLARQLLKSGSKRARKIMDIDPSNPITYDTTDFFIMMGKGIIKIGKELL